MLGIRSINVSINVLRQLTLEHTSKLRYNPQYLVRCTCKLFLILFRHQENTRFIINIQNTNSLGLTAGKVWSLGLTSWESLELSSRCQLIIVHLGKEKRGHISI